MMSSLSPRRRGKLSSSGVGWTSQSSVIPVPIGWPPLKPRDSRHILPHSTHLVYTLHQSPLSFTFSVFSSVFKTGIVIGHGSSQPLWSFIVCKWLPCILHVGVTLLFWHSERQHSQNFSLLLFTLYYIHRFCDTD